MDKHVFYHLIYKALGRKRQTKNFLSPKEKYFVRFCDPRRRKMVAGGFRTNQKLNEIVSEPNINE